MRTIQRERVTKSYYNVYVANDGTEFNDESECKKYDDSARCVLSAKYKELIVADTDEWSLFGAGNDEGTVEVLKISSQSDVDLVLQMLCLIQRLAEDSELERRVTIKAKELLERALNEDGIMLVGRGYGREDFWCIGTPKSIVENISKAIAAADKKD